MIIVQNPSRPEWAALQQRAAQQQAQDVEQRVQQIFEDVRQRGDAALLDYARQFDRADLAAAGGLRVSSEELAAAAARVPSELQTAIRQAHANIYRFHAGSGSAGGARGNHAGRELLAAGGARAAGGPVYSGRHRAAVQHPAYAGRAGQAGRLPRNRALHSAPARWLGEPDHPIHGPAARHHDHREGRRGPGRSCPERRAPNRCRLSTRFSAPATAT